MNIVRAILSLFVVLGAIPIGRAQGFVNLDFEAANVAAYPPGSVPRTLGIPGWAAYISGTPQTTILYNNATLGEASVSLQGVGGAFQTVQGQFSVVLQATFFAPDTNSAAIGQTATVPASTQSLIFWGDTSLSRAANDMDVTFNGEVIPYLPIGSGSHYTIYGANFAPFAGQFGELRFTAFNNTYAAVDNIQFSALPVPEPARIAFAGLVAAMLVVRRWKAISSR